MLRHYKALLLGLGFSVLAIIWLYLLNRLVHTERLANEARVEQTRESLKVTLSQFAEERWNSTHDSTVKMIQARLEQGSGLNEMIPDLLKLNTFSSVSFQSVEPTISESTLSADQYKSLLIRYQSEGLKVDHFLKEYQNEHYIENGRDLVTSIMLSLAEKNPDHAHLWTRLKQRTISYQGPELSPSFRLHVINSLPERDESVSLLAKHLSIIVSPDQELYEVVEATLNDGVRVQFYWTQDDLIEFFNNDAIHSFHRNATKDSFDVGFLTRFSHLELSLDDRELKPHGFTTRSIALLCGLLAGGFVLLVLYFSKKATQLAELKTGLASTMAHELRTPLAGQRILLESLLEGGDLPENKRREYLEMSFAENKRLNKLAENFLTFSRLDRNELAVQKESISANGVLQKIGDSLKTQWIDKDTSCIRITTNEQLPIIQADEFLLDTAIMNLLENAWKYSGEEKHIHLRALADESEIQFIVEDEGIGISSHNQKRVFERYFRVDQRLAREREGVGLGLSIVKYVASAHGGSVSVESTLGEGSTFTIHIPIF